MDAQKILEALPQALILGVVGILALLVLLVPIALRMAGLSGQQIVDVVTMTTKFFVEVIREFRNENKIAP